MGSSPPLRTLVSLLDLQCASALHGSSSSWTVVRPTRVPKHRAQCAGDGRRARRLAEVRAEPFPASLLVRRHSCALLVATSRQAASRDQQPRGLRPASSSCCRRSAAEQARAAARVPVPGRPAGHARKRTCQPLVAALSQIRTTTTFESSNNNIPARRTQNCTQRKEAKEKRSTNQTPSGRDNTYLQIWPTAPSGAPCGRVKAR